MNLLYMPKILILPTLAFRNLFPIRWSIPIAVATSSTSAPVASQRALMELMLLILWARKAFAALKTKNKKILQLYLGYISLS